MEHSTKAIYNALRFRAKTSHADEIAVKTQNMAWSIRNWRDVPLEVLFQELQELGYNLNKEIFRHYAEECDSPEELLGLFLKDNGESAHATQDEYEDRLYLTLFELWRRLLPERPSISILCDALDEAIFQYDTVLECSHEVIQNALEPILQLLKANVDNGVPPKAAFDAIIPHSSHDIPRFLADYLLDLIDQAVSNQVLINEAEDLVEQLEPYIGSSPWFMLVQAKLLAFRYDEEALNFVKRALALVLQQQKQEASFYIEALGVVRFFDNLQLVETLIELSFNALTCWEDLLQLAEELSHFALVNDAEKSEKQLDDYLDRVEASKELKKPFASTHPFVRELIRLGEECVKSIAAEDGNLTSRN